MVSLCGKVRVKCVSEDFLQVVVIVVVVRRLQSTYIHRVVK